MTPIDYGSAKSSGSISESSASESSLSGSIGSSGSSGSTTSGGGGGGGTGSDANSSSSSSSSDSGSSGGYCSWEIVGITYSADNEMMFGISNTGTVNIEFTAIWVASDPSMIVTTVAPEVSPSTAGASFFVAPGEVRTVAVVSNGDLRGVEFYIDGSCGFKFDTFPNA